MKCSVRPLFLILPIIVILATLSFLIIENRALLRRTSSFSHDTLLKYAAIDLAEEQSKQEIQKLLEANFDRINSGRSFYKSHKHWSEFQTLLHDWSRKKRYDPRVMLELTRLIKHPIDKHNGYVPSDQRYPSCAVVGNSGILLNNEYGPLIDSHEVVIRLNNARVKGFEAKVGSKTNISFINSNILHLCAGTRDCSFCHPYGAHVPIVTYMCQPLHLLDYRACGSSQKAAVIVTDPRLDVVCGRIVKFYSLRHYGKGVEEWGREHEGVWFHYSSGMEAVVMAMGVCERVSVFGFGKMRGVKHHYHTNQEGELRLHDYEAEYEFYRDLEKENGVRRKIPFLSEAIGFHIPSIRMYQ